ncbi:MAG TPA: helix-turn-helix domain-containing protein [Acidimicrobiia bacterium]
MAEATTQITVTPKELGRHLRSIRRKKGLSLSEVARGAGLSRRELVAYERGKVPIPESDLWVLAGSCGVDVAELMPSTSSLELTAAANATSVGDTVSQLRRSQEDVGVTPYLHTLQKLQALPAGKRIPVKERELEQIATALGSTPRSIEQKLQDVLNVSPDEAERLRAMILVPPNTKGRTRALAAAPSALAAAAAAPAIETAPIPPMAAVPTPTPFAEAPVFAAPAPFVEAAPVAEAPTFAEAPVFADPVQTFPAAPPAFLDRPIDAPVDDEHGHNIDVFEELARLPEPVPLGDPSAPMPDLLAPQDPFDDPFAGVPAVGPPPGAVELVDSTMPAGAGAGAWNAADAPPIDVAMRQGSATWDLGEPPLVAKTSGAGDPAAWETGGWQPPVPEGTHDSPSAFWEGTDDWTPGAPGADLPGSDGVSELLDLPVDVPVAEAAPAEPIAIGEDTWAGSAWDPQPWSPDAPVAAAPDALVDVNPWSADEWPREPADRGAWDHRPDPAAVDTGFYVDWGTDENETPPGWDAVVDQAATDTDEVDAPAAWDSWSHTDTTDTTDTVDTGLVDTGLVDTGLVDTGIVDERPAWESWTPATDTVEATDSYPPIEHVEHFDEDAPPAWDTWSPTTDTVAEPFEADPFVTPAMELTEVATAELTHISWRADGSHLADPVEIDAVEAEAAEETGTALTEPTDEIAPTDVTPLADWSLDAPDTIAEAASDPATTDWGQPSSTWNKPLEPAWIEPVATADPITITEPIAATVEFAEAFVAAEPVISAEPEPEPEPAAPLVEEFVSAGPDWQLGNALPLVEVRGQGGLVMRRADERWALADVKTAPDFVAEVEVDFRSGPGLGVLFRASIDDEGRMSGYSFDIDPIYDGGGYLVRQWQSDRELWNPIARVGGDDPTSMYGTLLVRLEVTGEHLSAQVNGVEVLAVENLKQASADRGRDAASGDLVGVQAWSSSDLVIDTVRVASR